MLVTPETYDNEENQTLWAPPEVEAAFAQAAIAHARWSGKDVHVVCTAMNLAFLVGGKTNAPKKPQFLERTIRQLQNYWRGITPFPDSPVPISSYCVPSQLQRIILNGRSV